MLFQSIASLWFALAIPAILLMYILRRTYIETEISSHLLWRQVLREQEANRPWKKLRRSLLLLLQLLAAALLVLALMQPYVWGRGGDEPVAIVLDVSGSMTSSASPGSEADDALEEAKEAILDWLRSRPSAGPVTLVAAGSEPELLLSGDTGGVRAVESALTSVKPAYGRMDIEAALSLAEAAIRSEADARLLVATDGRWNVPNEPDLGNGLLSRAQVLNVGGDVGNTAIAGFVLEAGRQENGRNAVAVTLVHAGTEPAEGVIRITPTGSGEPAAEQPYALQPGEQRAFVFGQLPEADYYRAELDSVDRYAADNIAYTFPVSAERGRALVVGSGNLFLNAALQLAGVDTIQADPHTYEPDEGSITDFDWVVLDGTDERTLQSDTWSRLLSSKPVWSIRSAVDLPEGRAVKEPADSRVEMKPHPVTAYLSFADTHIARFVEGDPGGGLEPIIVYGGVPAMYAGTVNGFPRLDMTFDIRDSDLALRSDFPILVSQAAEWMSGGLSPNIGRAEPGDRIEAGLRAGTVRAVWEAVERHASDDSLPNVMDTDRTPGGAVSSIQTAPSVPGLYRFVEYGEDGGIAAARLLAVQPALSEGLSFGMTEGQRAGTGLADDRYEDADGTRAESQMSLIPWIAALLLLLIAAEWEVYRRGIGR